LIKREAGRKDAAHHLDGRLLLSTNRKYGKNNEMVWLFGKFGVGYLNAASQLRLQVRSVPPQQGLQSWCTPLLMSSCPENQGQLGVHLARRVPLRGPTWWGSALPPALGLPLNHRPCPTVCHRPEHLPTNNNSSITTHGESGGHTTHLTKAGPTGNGLNTFASQDHAVSFIYAPSHNNSHHNATALTILRLGTKSPASGDLGISNRLDLAFCRTKQHRDFFANSTQNQHDCAQLHSCQRSSSTWPTACAARPTAPRTFWRMLTAIARITRTAWSTRRSLEV